MKRALFTLHLYLGVVSFVVLAVIGVSGSLIVFDHAIDERLNPDTLLRSAGSIAVQPGEALRAADQAVAQDERRAPYALVFPRHDRGVYEVWYRYPTASGEEYLEVYIDPTSGEVTGQRVYGDAVMQWLYQLHSSLLAGEVGYQIVGFSAVALFLLSLSGLYLWAPAVRRVGLFRSLLWKRGLKGVRWHYELHRFIGIYASVFLLVLSLTGFSIVYYQPVGSLARMLVPGQSGAAPEQDVGLSHNDSLLSVDDAVARAKSLLPRGTVTFVGLPSSVAPRYSIALVQPDDIRQSGGRSRVVIAHNDGRVLGLRDTAQNTASDEFLDWLFPLHNGEALGMPGRWLIALAGLTPLALGVTGLVVWWCRRGARGVARLKASAVSGVSPT